ncbi:hypothetical protein NPIL_168241 [Nephila pilipes]|uniref:Uncharacterized protein n=1 Tax=Nephila pilipes TaxID=299642 RepID=A0A8X6PJM1_NEPPI|nr:hypothetical protein NPIL_168241 [Nephila pilipes]
MMKNDSPVLLLFQFLRYFWQTNGRVPFRINPSCVALTPLLPHDRSKKQAIICFDVLLPRTTFVVFASSWKTHTVDCCFVSGSMHRSMIRHCVDVILGDEPVV